MRHHVLFVGLIMAVVSLLLVGYASRKVSFIEYRPQKNLFHIKSGEMYGNDGKLIWLTGMNLGQWLVLEGYLWDLGPHTLQRYEYNYAQNEILECFETVFADTQISWQDFIKHYRDVFITRDDIIYLKSIGINLIRVPFHAKDFTDFFETGILSDQDAFYLDRALGWCEEFHMYCLFDLHAAAVPQSTMTHADSAGEASLWQDTKAQAETISLWRALAERYKHESWLAGFDLLNEPEAPNTRMLKQWYEQTIRSIRSTGNQHVLFIQPNNVSLDIESVLQQDTGVVYAPHYYGSGRRAPQENEILFSMKKKYQVPVVIGEVGNWANDFWARHSDAYVLYRYLSHQIPIVYWNYKDMIGDNQSSFGIAHGNSSGSFAVFKQALEQHMSLPIETDVQELIDTFKTVSSSDRTDVTALITGIRPQTVMKVHTSLEEVQQMLAKDQPRHHKNDAYAAYIWEASEPYRGCNNQTVQRCFSLP